MQMLIFDVDEAPSLMLTTTVTLILTLTGQFADKPTRGQSSRGLVNSWTSQLADSEFF